jgi:transcriptional regulator with XRE-family HTH domain
MSRQVILTSVETDSLLRFSERLRLVRLRRNLSQADVAERAGVTRKVIVALEAGAPGTSIGVLAKVMGVLGYPERLAAMLESDPLGEDLEAVHGRKKAGGRADVADF